MFDRYLARPTGTWRRRALIGASLVAHALVGGFLFVTTLFTVEEIRPPALPLVFQRVPPPPPPPPPALGVRSSSTVVMPRRPQKLTQPSDVEASATSDDNKEKEVSDKNEEGVSGGVIGGSREGVQGGVLGGVEGGLVGSLAPVPVPPPAPPMPKMVASFVFDRERLNSPDPHLSKEFIHQHPNQTVSGMYRICVDINGKVVKMETVSSISGMDDLIIRQVKSAWLWKPQPHPVCTVRTFKFEIK